MPLVLCMQHSCDRSKKSSSNNVLLLPIHAVPPHLLKTVAKSRLDPLIILGLRWLSIDELAELLLYGM
ncbi:hypothetical protein PGT21_012085 [Puccinia graminis f. sp. tritici]|uniref:Uncharacterized protein n=1 Tax=Puccinia graminis f. sp. tritici TaxID=56615 RepID=A0A5B0QN34_PUCGR|nr:hypothetical protein PGT21_012085 [Puccinia graminis f. sp. tritici]